MPRLILPPRKKKLLLLPRLRLPIRFLPQRLLYRPKLIRKLTRLLLLLAMVSEMLIQRQKLIAISLLL